MHIEQGFAWLHLSVSCAPIMMPGSADVALLRIVG
jgi:hypothetical protein